MLSGNHTHGEILDGSKNCYMPPQIEQISSCFKKRTILLVLDSQVYIRLLTLLHKCIITHSTSCLRLWNRRSKKFTTLKDRQALSSAVFKSLWRRRAFILKMLKCELVLFLVNENDLYKTNNAVSLVEAYLWRPWWRRKKRNCFQFFYVHYRNSLDYLSFFPKCFQIF